MRILKVRNVTDALDEGLELLKTAGETKVSRAGDVLVVPFPVVTHYTRPRERVLLSGTRVGNPVFHVMSAIWMFAGSDDATWLDQWVHDFSDRFANDGVLHGAYGKRLRSHFGFDQIQEAIGLLRKDHNTRQVVLQLWDPFSDLIAGDDVKDRPCNQSVALRILNNALDITVFNRSNDLIWGLTGENHVQFSMLQEVIASAVCVDVGQYYHVSNNYHAYTKVLAKLPPGHSDTNPYREGKVAYRSLVDDPFEWLDDCERFVKHMDNGKYYNSFFPRVVLPMLYKTYNEIEDDDWRLACKMWKKLV